MISIRGLRALGTHGVLAEEQARAQPFEIDVDLDVDLSAAAASDDLDDTVDYGALAEAVERIVSGERHQLLERLAGRICDAALDDERVRAVTVTVRKLRPPVPVHVESVGVTLAKRRGG